jgi:hypothetical protein
MIDPNIKLDGNNKKILNNRREVDGRKSIILITRMNSNINNNCRSQMFKKYANIVLNNLYNQSVFNVDIYFVKNVPSNNILQERNVRSAKRQQLDL